MICRPFAARGVLSVVVLAGLATQGSLPVALAQPATLWPPADPGNTVTQREAERPGGDTVTKALLPGQWRLENARWSWVKPGTVLRPVQTAILVPGRYVWRRGSYVWVPAHYSRPEEAN